MLIPVMQHTTNNQIFRYEDNRVMELTTRSVDNIAILELQGRFDAHEAHHFTDWLEQHFTSSAYIVVNLSGVNFIDSTAIGTLVQGMKRCRQQKGDLRLCNLQQPVRIIFELTRLNRAFAMFASEDEAVQTPWS
jgi:anti-sigma B factor antagonist